MEEKLERGLSLPLSEESAHYLKNVLRRKDGSELRVFNGHDGEFSARINLSDRKKIILEIDALIKGQTAQKTDIHLIFAPIKKDRMDFMIEKAVELGATHFHPVLTQQTVIRDINEDRLRKQIQEAAEQCERLDIPSFAPLKKLDALIRDWPEEESLFVALERESLETFSIKPTETQYALLIGPEGGFSENERNILLESKKVKAVSLGEEILRAETAALYGLSLIKSAAR